MISQSKLIRVARRVTLLATVLAGAYLVMRFSVTRVPAGRCSPIVRFEPGAQLIVDGRPRRVTEGDAIIVRDRSGGLHLTLVERLRDDGALWCATDREDCPGFTSEDVGWVPRSAVEGRVLLSWGS